MLLFLVGFALGGGKNAIAALGLLRWRFNKESAEQTQGGGQDIL